MHDVAANKLISYSHPLDCCMTPINSVIELLTLYVKSLPLNRADGLKSQMKTALDPVIVVRS